MLVTDSVGLGTRGVLPAFFPADWDVSIVGKPAVFVRDLPGGYIQPNLFRAGDHVVIAAGYNYPFWDPVRFDNAIDATIATLTQAGVKHVYWVTLREVKPQYITAAGVAPGTAVLLVLPHGQRPPRTRPRSPPRPHADRLGRRRRSSGDHLRRDPSQPHRRRAVQLADLAGGHRRPEPSGERDGHEDQGRRPRSGRRG